MGIPDMDEMNERTKAERPCDFRDQGVLGAEATADYCYEHQGFCMDKKPSKEVMRYADASMFEAEPIEKPGEVVVHLLSMTEDPLGTIASTAMMYEGRVARTLAEINDEERWRYTEDIMNSQFKTPFEFVHFNFLIEGVPRSFTHQHVRQRHAAFAQESMRFAVKDNFAAEAYTPPSIAALPAHHPTRQKIDAWLQGTEELYNYLIANDIPAEDAREYLPQVTTTRIHWNTDLHSLTHHAGNRLCTQAQFLWRDVFSKIVEAIRNYSERGADLASLPLFKPACYQQGKCPFKASFDRGCTIRQRVDVFAANGVPSSRWGGVGSPRAVPVDLGTHTSYLPAIHDDEWMLDPKAAWQ